MRVISLEEVKANSRVDCALEDVYLYGIADVAEKMVEDALNKTWDEVAMQYDGIPLPLKHACLMLTDHLYTHRGASTQQNVGQLPYGVREMIKRYVRL